MRIDFPSKEQKKIAFFLLLFPLLSYYIPSYKGIVLFLSSNHSYLPFVEPIELPFIVGKKFKSDRIVEAPYQLGFLQKQKLFVMTIRQLYMCLLVAGLYIFGDIYHLLLAN